MIVRKATLLERLFGGLHEGADLYPADAVNPPGVNEQQRRRIDLQDMQRSQEIAAAVALRAAGQARSCCSPTGARVDGVEPGRPAVGKLEPDDVIVAVDGTPVRTPRDVFTAMSKATGRRTVVRFTVRRGKQTLVVPIKTVGVGPTAATRRSSASSLEPALDIHLPFPVRIDAGNVGGPSAGLAFALEVMEELGRDVVHGHKVAATGEICPRRLGRPDRRHQAEDDRRARGGCGCLPRPGWGQRPRSPQATRTASGSSLWRAFPQALRALATLGPSA